MMTSRTARKFFLALCAAFAISVPAAAQERVVNIYNWSDYIDPQVLVDFTKETGIKVRYDTFDSNDVVETKMLAGKTGYDIIVPSQTYLQRMIKAGVLQKLDKSKLPNLRHAWPEIEQRLAVEPDRARDAKDVRRPLGRFRLIGPGDRPVQIAHARTAGDSDQEHVLLRRQIVERPL